MDLGHLRSAVEAWAIERSDALALDRNRVDAEYLLNWGGFVNYSFRVGDGSTWYHLKLASTGDAKRGLRQWRSLDAALGPYHAPPIVDWASIPEFDCEGPLTAWIDGRSPERVTRALADAVLPVVARLHSDRGLAERLGIARAPATCADVFVATYGDRFTEDFRSVDGMRPPFVDLATMAFMRDEIGRFEAVVRRSPAFAEPAVAPTHGDLWANNLLVHAGDSDVGSWSLLDWDDLAIGDPVMDLAMFLGPTAAQLDGATCVDAAVPYIATDAARERFEIYRRAALFDWVIDSLSDWIEADVAPHHVEAVRAEKERIHVEALSRYLALPR